MCRRLALLLILLALPVGAQAATYYTDGACETSGTGATLTCGATGPFKTISEGITAMSAGDTLNIRGAHDAFDGVYNEYVGIWGTSGDAYPGKALACTSESPCIVQGCPASACGSDETPILSGWGVKTDWTSDGGGVYHRTMETADEWIGQEVPSNNYDPFYVAQGSSKTILQSATGTTPAAGHHSFSSPTLYVHPTGSCDPREAGCEIWVPQRRALILVGSQLGISNCPGGTCPLSHYLTLRRFALEGSRWLSILVAGTPGTFADHLTIEQLSINGGGRYGANGNFLTNLAMSDITITNVGRGQNHDVGGTFGWRFLNVYGGTLTNFTTQHIGQAGTTGGRGDLPWLDSPWHTMADNGAEIWAEAMDLKQSDHITITNHTCEDVAARCFMFDVTHDSTLDGFDYQRMMGGIMVHEYTPTGDHARNYNLTIRNGRIDNVGWNINGAIVIDSVSALGSGEYSVQIYNNIISRMSDSGLRVGDADQFYFWNNTIYGNRDGLGYTGSPSEPADGIKLIGTLTNSEFLNNVFVGQNASHYAIYAGAEDNTFDYGLYQDTPGGNRDCAIRWGATFQSGYGRASGGTCYATIAAFRTAQTKEVHGQEGDPQFVAPAAAPPNLHIQSTSAAKDSGLTLAEFNTDYDGQTRNGTWDVGADEYLGSAVLRAVTAIP